MDCLIQNLVITEVDTVAMMDTGVMVVTDTDEKD